MMTRKPSAEKTVRDIRRATRKHYSSEEKIRIVLEGLRGEESVAELCRREGINAKPTPNEALVIITVLSLKSFKYIQEPAEI